MRAMTEEEPSFGPELFAFLRELREHNEREWFNANKARYEAEVKEPALAFVEDFELLLPEVSPHFKGKLFRIYRDTRFGRDKTPYKTHTGIHFRHEQASSAHSLGFYLHLEPASVFTGFGIWRPEKESLQAIRTAIARRPDRWSAVSEPAGFLREGTALKRAPAGFDPEHPAIEEIKRKDFVAMRRLSEDEVTAAGFLQTYLALCRDAEPMMRFLCDACGETF
jgi:uncharacterized protein (TIGR02453 family)